MIKTDKVQTKELIESSVIVLFQIYAMPVFDMIETVLVKKLRFRPSWWLRFISRNVYVGKLLGLLFFVCFLLCFSMLSDGCFQCCPK